MANLNDEFDKATDLSKQFDAAKSIADSQQQEETSTLGALGAGAAKGASFGFDDEIAGIASAIAKKAGQTDKRDFWDIYKDVRDQVRDYHKKAEEEHPVASLGGELAGGLGTALVMPVGAAVEGAGFLTKAGQMAKAGAAYGALSGLGGSEADLTNPTMSNIGQAASDTASGAAGGAILGAGMQALGSAGSAAVGEAGNILSKYPVVKNFKTTFNLTREGEDLLGKVQNLSETNRNVIAADLIDTLQHAKDFSGKIMGEGISDMQKKMEVIKFGDIIDDLRTKAEALTPNSSQEESDIKAFIKSLDKYSNREIEKITSYIAGEAPPTTEQKVAQKLAGKTAEAEAKDAIKVKELQEQLETAIASGADDDEIARLNARINALQPQTAYPPENISEPLTGLDVLGVSRGASKQPLVAAINPPPQEIANIPALKVISKAISQDEYISPEKLTDTLKSLNETLSDPNISAKGRSLLQDFKDQLTQRLESSAAEAGPESKDAADLYNTGKELFGNVREAQKKLGLPSKFGVSETSSKENAISRINNMIQDYHSEGSEGRIKLDNALKELSKSYPEDAARLQQAIESGSIKEYIARQLQGTSSLGGAGMAGPVQASAKSVKLQTARALGKAAGALDEIPKAFSNKLVDLGKAVYDYAPEQLQNLADAARGKGGPIGEHISSTLDKIKDAPESRRRAVLFTLMQQPDFRNFVQEQMKGEGP